MPVKSARVAVIQSGCVACGCCEKACPLHAVSVYRGMYAVVDTQKCVGCGKCRDACPACVINILERGQDK